MIIVKNNSEHPTREVNKLVRLALGYQDITNIVVVVCHFQKRTWSGQERTWMGGGYHPSSRRVTAKIVKPGYKPYRYEPYSRKRGTCPSFDLNDWREQLIALVAHEAKHYKQHPGPYVENEADLAAFRAVGYYREDTK